jgi:hypothetical protein
VLEIKLRALPSRQSTTEVYSEILLSYVSVLVITVVPPSNPFSLLLLERFTIQTRPSGLYGNLSGLHIPSWVHMSVILAPRRLRQEAPEFQVSLGYIVRLT